MPKLFTLAWRNVWRNRRRSLITMSAIVFSVLLIAAANSVQYGTYDAMESLAVRLFSGDLQIHRAGYQDEQTFSYALTEDEQDWEALLAEVPEVEAAARRLTGFGLASSDSSSAGVMILGIEPEKEPRVSLFANTPEAGRRLRRDDDHGALLGTTLARNLGLGLGDTVVVLTQGYQGAMGADLFVVRGLLKSGSAELDRATLVITLPDAQSLFSMPGGFTQLAVRTADFRAAETYAAALRTRLPASDYEVMAWEELMPELGQMRALDDAGNLIFYFFLVVLLGFEIFNTTTMSIIERVREFGVMQAVGMKPIQLSLLVLLELAIKVTLALAAGVALVLLGGMLFGGRPIPLPEDMMQLYEDMGFLIDGITFSTRPVVLLTPLVSITIIALLSMIYPVLKVLDFTPVEALHHA